MLYLAQPDLTKPGRTASKQCSRQSLSVKINREFLFWTKRHGGVHLAAVNADVMDSEMLERYKSSPEKLDSEVRQRFGIPENRYYTVAVFPPTVAGKVTIERERLVKAHKISKSDAN